LPLAISTSEHLFDQQTTRFALDSGRFTISISLPQGIAA